MSTEELKRTPSAATLASHSEDVRATNLLAEITRMPEIPCQADDFALAPRGVCLSPARDRRRRPGAGSLACATPAGMAEVWMHAYRAGSRKAISRSRCQTPAGIAGWLAAVADRVGQP